MAYNKTNWQNLPSTTTPVVASNLNKIEDELELLDQSAGIPTNSIIGYDGSTVPGGYEETDGPNDYSATEKVIGKWIDGKPVYRKVINTGALPDGTTYYSWKEVAHGISNLGTVVKIYGSATDGSNILPLPHVSSAQTAENVRVSLSGTNIFISDGTNRASYTSSYIILEYTKSTD